MVLFQFSNSSLSHFFAVSNNTYFTPFNCLLHRPSSADLTKPADFPKEDEGNTTSGSSANTAFSEADTIQEDSQITPPLSENKDTAETLKKRLMSLNDPIQPQNFTFPPRLIGGRQRHFQLAWFNKYPWLHYDICTDSAFCYNCLKANQTNALSTRKADAAFVTKGFTNWKKALTKDGFGGHELAHREATLRMVKAPAEYGNVGVNLSEKFMFEQINNRKMLLKILSNVRYLGKFHRNISYMPSFVFTNFLLSMFLSSHLARQAIPLRGSWRGEFTAEKDSNLYQLLMLRAEEDQEISHVSA